MMSGDLEKRLGRLKGQQVELFNKCLDNPEKYAEKLKDVSREIGEIEQEQAIKLYQKFKDVSDEDLLGLYLVRSKIIGTQKEMFSEDKLKVLVEQMKETRKEVLRRMGE